MFGILPSLLCCVVAVAFHFRGMGAVLCCPWTWLCRVFISTVAGVGEVKVGWAAFAFAGVVLAVVLVVFMVFSVHWHLLAINMGERWAVGG